MSNYARYGTAAAAFAALMTLGAGTVAHAHHAFAAEFDSEAPVLLKGTDNVFEWTNPHTWIHLKFPDTDAKGQEKPGTTFSWMVEGGTPNTLLRSGITRHRSNTACRSSSAAISRKTRSATSRQKTKKKTCKANGRDVTFPNGCKLFVGSSGTGAPPMARTS